MQNTLRQDFLIRTTVLLIFIYLLIWGLYLTRELLVPVFFAITFAILMLPLSKRLERKLPKWLSIIICILIILAVIVGIIFLFSSQIISLGRDLPQYRDKIEAKWENIQSFVEKKTHMSSQEQIAYIKARTSTFFNTASSYLTNFLAATTGTLAGLSLMLIYMFFFMFYEDKFRYFILKVVPNERHDQTKKIIGQVSSITQQYLLGKLIVTVILAVLNSLALVLIGVKHAVFFGTLAAILNLIPYVGTLIGGIFPIIMVLITKDTITPAIMVAVAFSINQFIENNFLTPYIVGSSVNINALFSIFAVLIGGYLWGAAGMILFIPMFAVAKIIFDHIDVLRPYGYLMGEKESSTGSYSNKKINKLLKKENEEREDKALKEEADIDNLK